MAKYLDMNGLQRLVDLTKSTFATRASMESKVSKVEGKGLSTNDYTNEDKDKLKGIEEGATKTTVVNSLTSTSTTSALSAEQGRYLRTLLSGLSQYFHETLLETAPIDHTHTIANITGLKNALDSKQSKITIGTTAPTSTTGYSDGDIFLVVP